eukprot:1597697-Rhodomonas_salina.1
MRQGGEEVVRKRGEGGAVAGEADGEGSRWDEKGPREGLLAPEEGRLEEAPQPCMLLQSTSAAVKDLWPASHASSS